MPSSSTVAKENRRRKLITIGWLTLISAVTIFLLYKEMIAVLYILATLGVTFLLVVVAKANLAHDEINPDNVQRIDDSAAIGSGISSVTRRAKK